MLSVMWHKMASTGDKMHCSIEFMLEPFKLSVEELVKACLVQKYPYFCIVWGETNVQELFTYQLSRPGRL
jgi:hypothetical protein